MTEDVGRVVKPNHFSPALYKHCGLACFLVISLLADHASIPQPHLYITDDIIESGLGNRHDAIFLHIYYLGHN